MLSEPELRLPDLAGAEAEAHEIATLYPRTRLLTGPSATKENFLDRLGGQHVVHFAGHAISNDSFPGLSRLLFAATSEGSSGSLFAHEIATRNLSSVRIVVLAGCRTSSGLIRRGEGVMSLARPFLAAGVPTVLATLWDVNDRTSRPSSSNSIERLPAGLPRSRPSDGRNFVCWTAATPISPRPRAGEALLPLGALRASEGHVAPTCFEPSEKGHDHACQSARVLEDGGLWPHDCLRRQCEVSRCCGGPGTELHVRLRGLLLLQKLDRKVVVHAVDTGALGNPHNHLPILKIRKSALDFRAPNFLCPSRITLENKGTKKETWEWDLKGKQVRFHDQEPASDSLTFDTSSPTLPSPGKHGTWKSLSLIPDLRKISGATEMTRFDASAVQITLKDGHLAADRPRSHNGLFVVWKFRNQGSDQVVFEQGFSDTVLYKCPLNGEPPVIRIDSGTILFALESPSSSASKTC